MSGHASCVNMSLYKVLNSKMKVQITFFKVINKESQKKEKLSDVLDTVQTSMNKLETTGTSVVLVKEAGVIEKVGKLTDKIVRVESQFDDKNGFQRVK